MTIPRHLMIINPNNSSFQKLFDSNTIIPDNKLNNSFFKYLFDNSNVISDEETNNHSPIDNVLISSQEVFANYTNKDFIKTEESLENLLATTQQLLSSVKESNREQSEKQMILALDNSIKRNSIYLNNLIFNSKLLFAELQITNKNNTEKMATLIEKYNKLVTYFKTSSEELEPESMTEGLRRYKETSEMAQEILSSLKKFKESKPLNLPIDDKITECLTEHSQIYSIISISKEQITNTIAKHKNKIQEVTAKIEKIEKDVLLERTIYCFKQCSQ